MTSISPLARDVAKDLLRSFDYAECDSKLAIGFARIPLRKRRGTGRAHDSGAARDPPLLGVH